MSKTKDKRAERKREQSLFLLARRTQQVSMLRQAFDIGNKLYEDNKEKLSEEEARQIELMRKEQLDVLTKLEAEIKEMSAALDEVNPNPQA